MSQLRYLVPFGFLALLPFGGWLGGAWTFLAAGATPVMLAGLDAMLGSDVLASGSNGSIARWLPRMYVVLQLAANVWAAIIVARPSTGWLEAVGLTLSAGVTTGVFGFLAAHEMVHSPNRRDRALGLIVLASVFYMHFRISHIHGHHRRAATADDPASARLGEGLYAFLLRSVAGQAGEAWTFEAERLRRTDQRIIGPGNRMLQYFVVEGAILIAVGMLSLRALLFLVAVAALAVAMLESFNYVAHYGLSRRLEADGRPERLAPHHSWNSARKMNNAALFNMGRHSDHHRVMTRSYEELEPVGGSAQLPAGYAAALLTALAPPLWRRVMDPRARAAMGGP